MIIYLFIHCPCTYESAYATMSIHKTVKGAYESMKKHRIDNFNEWRSRPNRFRKDFKDTFAMDWAVEKTELID